MQNSLYVSDRRKKRKQRRKYLFGALAIIALYCLLYSFQWLMFRSPLFRVDKVVVEGNNVVASSDIISLAEASALPTHSVVPAVFGFDNMLTWPDQISPNDLAMIPQLAGASISKDYFAHTVTISVSERVPLGIWCFVSSGDCYWFDNTGTIFQRSLDTQSNAIFDVQDSAQAEKGLNEKILSDEFLPNFLSIINVLSASGLSVKEIDLTDLSLEQVNVQITNGPVIYFSLNFPADDDLGYIQKLAAEPGFDTIQYIDCTTQDRIYYK